MIKVTSVILFTSAYDSFLLFKIERVINHQNNLIVSNLEKVNTFNEQIENSINNLKQETEKISLTYDKKIEELDLKQNILSKNMDNLNSKMVESISTVNNGREVYTNVLEDSKKNYKEIAEITQNVITKKIKEIICKN